MRESKKEVLSRSPVVNGHQFPATLAKFRQMFRAMDAPGPSSYLYLAQNTLTPIGVSDPAKQRFQIEIHLVPEEGVPRTVVEDRKALIKFRRRLSVGIPENN